MKQEKSCGALVYRKRGGGTELLLLRHRNGGHWSFPKGHVEAGENEIQTALREVKEETGLDIRLLDGFRESVEYCPKPNVKKQVVYFLGCSQDGRVSKQEEEISEIRWMPIEEAGRAVTFRNDRNLIVQARDFLTRRRPVRQPARPKADGGQPAGPNA